MAQTTVIQVEIEVNSIPEKKSKEKLLQSLARLPIDVLETISELNTEKGIAMLRENKELIKSFI